MLVLIHGYRLVIREANASETLPTPHKKKGGGGRGRGEEKQEDAKVVVPSPIYQLE